MLTVIGAALGAIFRFLPEVLKFFDQKNERAHEISMQDKALEFQKLKGDQKIDEIDAKNQGTYNEGYLKTLQSAIAGQESLCGVPWIDGVVKLVRPLITYWFFALYCFVKVCLITCAILHSDNMLVFTDSILKIWTEADMAMLAGILNFWFLGRVFDKVK